MEKCRYDKERIERLRMIALDPSYPYAKFYLHFYRRYLDNSDLLHMEIRCGDALKYAFSQIDPSIDEDELIVGKPGYELTAEEQSEWENLSRTTILPLLANNGQDSHRAIDYQLLLQQGVCGVLKRIREKRSKLNLCLENDMKKDVFYQSAELALDATVILANRYAEKAELLADNRTDDKRKAELKRIASVCRRVPEFPAENFYEAIQSAHFMTFCVSIDPCRPFCCQQFQLGHPDEYLYPYYEKDIREGKITKEEAQTLFDCLGIQINHRVPHGLSSGYMVGGRDKNGQLISNDLTRMGMQVIEDIRLVFPAVGLCYCKDTPSEDLEFACDILGKGYSHPAIFNDDVITNGLMSYGVPEQEAHRYIHSTCVEITPVASSNVWVASPYINLPQFLLDSMDHEYPNMDKLLGAIFEKLGATIRDCLQLEISKRVARSNRSVHPLLSCFTNDCIELGCDVERGGAKHNWIMPSFVGMANLIDSLFVIQKLIFEAKQYTITQLKEMIDQNFEGHEAERRRMLNTIEKYGNDFDEIDSYADRITKWINAECRKYEFNDRNGKLIPSVFCWIMHDLLGQQTGATPDGRQAGFPLGDGSGPAQGREHKGPTASILSSTKWDHSSFIGGVAVNMKFSKKMFTEDSKQKLMALIKTYIARGGFEFQINVTDRETLLNAQKTPELYQDLVVRIGGYSDYFVKLSPTMQEEVLLRTEHDL